MLKGYTLLFTYVRSLCSAAICEPNKEKLSHLQLAGLGSCRDELSKDHGCLSYSKNEPSYSLMNMTNSSKQMQIWQNLVGCHFLIQAN